MAIAPEGNRLKALREERDIERYDICAHLRIGEDSVRGWEENKRLIPSKHIEPLARFLGVDPSYLMGWDRKSVNKAAA